MGKFLPFLFLALCSQLALAQSPRIFTSAGSGLNDEPLDVIRHSSGSIITTGYYNQLASFGGIILSFSGSDDAFISSQSSNGSYTWAKQVAGPLTDRGVILREGPDGSIYLAGYFRGTAQYDNLSITSNSATQDVFVAKIDAITGSPIWFRAYGGSAIENLSGMAINQSGQIWISGQFNGNAQFGSTSFTSTDFYNSGQSGYDIYLSKLSAEGDVISANQYSSPDNDFVTGLDLDSSDNIYMTLQAAASLNLGSQTLNLSNALSGVMIKFSSSANYLYYRTLNAPFLDIRALDVKNDLVVIGGNYSGTLTCSTPGFPSISGEYENRIFGICLNSDGSYRSHFEESSSNNLNLNDISINNIGKIWAGGNFNCTLNSISDDLGEGMFNNIGFKDIFLAYYASDSSNVRTFEQIFGGKGDDDVFSVFADDERYPTIAGSFSNKMFNKYVPNCLNCGVLVGNSFSSYCDYSNYSNVYYNSSTGSKDIFCTTAIDTTTNLLDIYSRSGSACELSVIEPNIFPNQDTLYLCNPASIRVDHNIIYLSSYNENFGSSATYYNREWKRDGTFLSSSNSISANTTAEYTVKLSTGDNCRVFYDTIQVIMLENIENPGIYVEGATLYEVISSPSGCDLNIPTAYQQEITVHGQTFNESDSLTWVYFTPTPFEVVAINTPEVNLSATGNYNYGIETESGCVGSTCFTVWQYINLTFGAGGGGEFIGSPGGTLPDEPEFSFSFDNVVSDTIEVCKNNGWPYATLSPQLVLMDEDSVYNPLTSPAFAYWTISGPGVTFPIVYSSIPPDTVPRYSFFNHYNMYRVTQSGWVTIKFDLLRPWQNTDTIFSLTKNFYVILNDGLEASIIFSSSTDGLCPGDTTTLSFTVEPDYPFTATAQNSLGQSGENSYDYAFPGSLMVNIQYSDSASGCTLSRSATRSLVYKEAPNIYSNPASARKCPEDSVLIFGETGQSINWIGPAGDTLGNNFNIHVVPPGNYYYDLIDNDGCSLLSNTIEVRNIQAVIYDSIITSNMCGGQSALILLAPDTNLVYQWLPPLSGSDTIKYINQPGVYSVSVALCSNRDTLTFEVAQGLSEVELEIISEEQFLCEGATVELQANLLATSYLWEPGNTTEAQLILDEPGWAKVTVYDTLGCVLSDSLQFQVYPNPSTPPQINVPEACPGTPISLSVESNFPFIWHSLPDTTVLSAGSFYEVDVDSSGQIFGGYAINPQTGCKSTWIENSTVLLTATNIAEIPEDILFCPGDTIEFIPADAQGIQDGFWTGPNQFSLNTNALFIPDIESFQEGFYRYTAISAAGYCTYDTAEIHIQERYLDAALVVYPDSICDNEAINFSVQENSNYNYSWVGPPALNHQGSDWNIADSNPDNTGLFHLTARDGNCLRTDSFYVFVSAIPPAVPSIASSLNICIGDTLFLYNADSLNTIGANISWFGPDVLQTNGDNIAFIPNFQADMIPGLGIQYGINMCLSSVTNANIQAQPYPVFAFLYHEVEFCEGDAFQLSSPIEAFAYDWSNGSASNTIQVYESDVVYLTVYNEYGCRYTDSVIVEAIVCNLDNTPNAFSPNADGFNDFLTFKVDGGLIYRATIFDRWGKLIKDLNGVEYDWDGSNYKGEPVDDGTYFYILAVQMVNGKTKELQGTVNVFR